MRLATAILAGFLLTLGAAFLGTQHGVVAHADTSSGSYCPLAAPDPSREISDQWDDWSRVPALLFGSHEPV